MATTTNYGWTTPDDTALVKDGASAIRTLGTAIDTTTFNNASAAIAKTIVDAKGDIIAATAADTVSRLAVGANDTVLTADSTSATGLKWASAAAGGMTSIATGTLSGASVSITSIPSTYNQLFLTISNPYITSGTALFQMTFNSNTTANSYTEVVGTSAYDDASVFRINVAAATLDTANNSYAGFGMYFDNYAATNATKTGRFTWLNYVRGDKVNAGFGWNGGDTTAISSLQIKTSASTFAGGTYTLWGVK